MPVRIFAEKKRRNRRVLLAFGAVSGAWKRARERREAGEEEQKEGEREETRERGRREKNREREREGRDIGMRNRQLS